MTFLTVALVIFGTLTSAVAQLFLKAGTNALAQSESSGWLQIALRTVFQPSILAGIFCYILGMAVWLLVLSRLQVSVAYPMLSLGYIVTAIFGFYLFGEPLSWTKIVGIFVIIIGVVLVSSSAN